MKTRTMKTRTAYSILAACLSTAPAALGQTPPPQPANSGMNISGFAWQTPLTQHILRPGGAKAGGANYVPPTPEEEAKNAERSALERTSAASLHAGRYAQAEVEARQAISIIPDSGVAEEVLAAALDAQGKEKEALQAYRVMVVDQKAGYTRVLLPYALLLLKSGQWAQAVAVYNQAITSLPSVGPHLEKPIVQDGDVMRANSHFSPDVPEPTALATAIHIADGLVYNATPDWAGESQNTEAVAEYGKALQLAPDAPLVNYYYGVGWQKLSPAERAQVGSVQQAKAALQKAVLLGKGDVKKAALKALKNFNKPANKPA